MASLYNEVRDNRESLNEGMAYIAFYKDGRSWKTQEIYDVYYEDDLLVESEEELEKLKEIAEIDPNAILFNGYEDCLGIEDFSLQELTNLIKRNYNLHFARISDELIQIIGA